MNPGLVNSAPGILGALDSLGLPWSAPDYLSTTLPQWSRGRVLLRASILVRQPQCSAMLHSGGGKSPSPGVHLKSHSLEFSPIFLV